MFCCYLLEACSFLMIDRKGVNPEVRGGEEELVCVEGGETIIRMYRMGKESISSKRNKMKKVSKFN